VTDHHLRSTKILIESSSIISNTTSVRRWVVEWINYILEYKGITDIVRAVVQEYKDTLDAQKVYQKLSE
jgi:hypothetical protein